MKIYTKKGDKGITCLTGGKKILKNDIHVESYGSIDELNAYIGLIISQNINESDKLFLLGIQKTLFRIGNYIASDYSEVTVCDLKPTDISILENEIDNLCCLIEPLRNFILPNGNQTVAFIHVARTICRRTERIIISQNARQKMNENILVYINRLSDYLFVLARKTSKDFGEPELTL